MVAGMTSKTRVPRERVAVASEALMLGCFAIQNYVELPPWNNLEKAGSQLPSSLMGLVPGAGVVAALARGGPRAKRVAAVWCWIWRAPHIAQWWVPYLFDTHPLTQDGGKW